MENVSKALLIAGAVIVCILIIAVGMYVFNDSQSTIADSMVSMSTQEIDAHNTKFAIYDGEQLGSKLKSLVGLLMSNSDTNKEEPSKIPGMYIEFNGKFLDSGLPENGDNSSYIDALENIRTQLESKHEYWVEINYQKNGLIDYITVSYDADDAIEPMSRR